MFFTAGAAFLVLLSLTLLMLWAHERAADKRIVPHARIEEYWSGVERREHPRFQKALEVEYSVEKKPRLKDYRAFFGPKAGTGKTINISKGGMKLLMDEKLPKDAIVDLKITIPERRQTIEVEGAVVWTKDTDIKDPSGKRFFHSGIKFIAIKEPSGTRLSEYIASLKSRNA